MNLMIMQSPLLPGTLTRTYAIKLLGGIFSALAEKILKRGIVFGVTYADDFKSARHIVCDSVADIGKLRGSKYYRVTSKTSLVW